MQEGSKNRVIAREEILHLPIPSMPARGLAFDARDAIGLAMVLERYARQAIREWRATRKFCARERRFVARRGQDIKALFNAQLSGRRNREERLFRPARYGISN